MAPRDHVAQPGTGSVAEIKIRVRGDLRPKLEEAAARHGTTLNGEVVRRVEESFELDAKLRELDVQREHMRDAIKEFSQREHWYQQRINQLTDFLLQAWPSIRAQEKEQNK